MKNKRIVSFVLLLSLTMLLLVSCKTFNSARETDKDINTTEPQNEADKNPINLSEKPSNGRIEDFYSDDAVVSVSLEAISDYIEKTVASSQLISLYADSDNVSLIPILGTYLEKTSLCVCLFEKQGTLIGTKALSVDSNGNVLSELEQLLGESYIRTAFMDEYCFNVISDCLKDYPEFDIKGIVYDESGYTMIYPVGNNAGNESIQLYNYELTEFNLIDSFISLEDGREKFDVYWNFRSNLISEIPIFDWKTVSLHPLGYLNKYRYQDIYSSNVNVNSCQYLFDCDWYLVIPLLNGNGNEGEYVLHLLYHKDKLIAELILQQNPDGIVRLSKELVSNMNTQTNTYTGLNSIDYVEKCSQLLSGNNQNIKGIGFDGEKYIIIYN